ncbi:MORC family CW-type zinc finger protein 3-like [Sparus aurata]|uniref:MORC family CW-type zinc finger protein 3-like n=1 Tax=Sparus aurata TaxID=8175 RepID=UPI0011C1A023|nr:MORC family CW-type zinc finger protein 3-like [Sparus aurata]
MSKTSKEPAVTFIDHNVYMSTDEIEEEDDYINSAECTVDNMPPTSGKQLSEKKIPPFVQAFSPVAVCWGILLIIMALRIYFTSVISTKLSKQMNYSEEADKYIKRVSNRSSTDDNLERDPSILRDQIDKMARAYTVLQTKITTLSGEKEQLTAENQQVKAENQQVKTEIQQVKTENQQVKTENQQVKTENQQMKTENQQVKTEIRQMKTEIQQVKTEIQQVKTENQQVKTENQQMKTENQQVKTENQQVKTENQQMKTENQQVKTENQQVKAEIKMLKLLLEGFQSTTQVPTTMTSSHGSRRLNEVDGEVTWLNLLERLLLS